MDSKKKNSTGCSCVLFLVFFLILIFIFDSIFSSFLKPFGSNSIIPNSSSSDLPIYLRFFPIGNSQFGTILEFLGYWFGLRIILPNRKAQLEDKLEDVGKRYHWYILISFFYIQLIDIFGRFYNFNVAESKKTSNLIFDTLSLLIYLFLGYAIAKTMNKIMDSYTINSFESVRRYLKLLWKVSGVKKQVIVFIKKFLKILLVVLLPILSIYLIFMNPLQFNEYTNVFQLNKFLNILLYPLLFLFLYFFEILSFLFYFIWWGVQISFLFGLIFGTAAIVKGILFRTVDNKTIGKRVSWWVLFLTSLGLYLQLDAANPGPESAGILIEIFAFSILFIYEYLPSQKKEIKEKEIRVGKVSIVGIVIMLIGILTQSFYTLYTVNRLGLIAEATSVVIGNLADIELLSKNEYKILIVASIFFVIGFALQLFSTYS